MGFLSAMKGANNSWGFCTSSDFNGPCYLGPKNLVNNTAQELAITGTSVQEYVFTKKDVAACEVKASGSNWIWFHIAFKDGKHVEFIMPEILEEADKSQKSGMLSKSRPNTNYPTRFINFLSFMGM